MRPGPALAPGRGRSRVASGAGCCPGAASSRRARLRRHGPGWTIPGLSRPSRGFVTADAGTAPRSVSAGVGRTADDLAPPHPVAGWCGGSGSSRTGTAPAFVPRAHSPERRRCTVPAGPKPPSSPPRRPPRSIPVGRHRQWVVPGGEKPRSAVRKTVPRPVPPPHRPPLPAPGDRARCRAGRRSGRGTARRDGSGRSPARGPHRRPPGRRPHRRRSGPGVAGNGCAGYRPGGDKTMTPCERLLLDISNP